MKRFLALVVLAVLLPVAAQGVEIKTNLEVSCGGEGDEYFIRIENGTYTPVRIWVVPVGMEDSEFEKTPFGAMVYPKTADRLFNGRVGRSREKLISEKITFPVRMEELGPGKSKRYRFRFMDIFGYGDYGIERLRAGELEYKVAVRVYFDDHLKYYSTCVTEWIRL